MKNANLRDGTLPRGWKAAIILPIAIVLVGACERADRPMVPGDSIRSGWASQDRPSGLAPAPDQRVFLESAAQNGLFEIEASRIALARGGSAAVRRFAEATLRNRLAIETDLQQLAQSVGVPLPTHLSETLQTRLAVLSEVDAADFDRAYARTVGVATQEETIAAFERAADQRGERVQRFAADQLPALREHLEWARKLASQLDRTRMADGSASRFGASS